MGGDRKVLDCYPCLKHLVQLWPGNWVNQMGKMNEAVGMENRVTMNGGGKRLVRPFKSQEFWKYIGCIISEDIYGKKGHTLWSEIPKSFVMMENPKLRRDVRGNTDLCKGMFLSLSSFLHLCLPFNYFILHNFVHFLGVSLSTYLYFSFYRFAAYTWQGLRISGHFGHAPLLIRW